MTTGIFGRTAPVGSVTKPLIPPDVFCAITGTAASASMQRASIKQLHKRFITFPHQKQCMVTTHTLYSRSEPHRPASAQTQSEKSCSTKFFDVSIFSTPERT